MIDTHKQVKNLTESGFTDKQAEGLVMFLSEALERQSASIKQEIKQDFKDLEYKMTSDKKDLDIRFKDLENKINIVLVKVTGTVFSLMLAFKILDKFI